MIKFSSRIRERVTYKESSMIICLISRRVNTGKNNEVGIRRRGFKEHGYKVITKNVRLPVCLLGKPRQVLIIYII